MPSSENCFFAFNHDTNSNKKTMPTSHVLFIRQKTIRNTTFCTMVIKVEECSGLSLRISEHFMNTKNHCANKVLFSLPQKLAHVCPFTAPVFKRGKKSNSRYLCF